MKLYARRIVCPFCGNIANYAIAPQYMWGIEMYHHVADNDAEYIQLNCQDCKEKFHIELQMQIIVVPYRRRYRLKISNVYGRRIPVDRNTCRLSADGVGLWPGVGENIKDTWPNWRACRRNKVVDEDVRRHLLDRRLL